MRKRRLISYLLCFVMCAFYAAPTALADSASTLAKDVVLYSNDFEGGLNEAYNRLGKDGVSKVDTFDLGGDFGKVMRFYGSPENTVTDYREVRFDLSKPMNAGDMFSISYDLICGQTGNFPFMLYTSKTSSGKIVSGDQYVTVVNGTVAAANGAYGYYKTADKNTPSGWTPVKLSDVSKDTPMHIDIMIKMTESGREYTFLVDGKICGNWTNTYKESIPAIFMSNTVYAAQESYYYVDNLVIKQLAEPKANGSVSGAMGGDTVEVEFSDSFNENLLSEIGTADISIKNRLGEAVSIKSVSANGNRLIIKLQNPFEYDENYTLDLSKVKDIYGRKASDIAISSQSEIDDDGNVVLRIKNTKAILCDGTKIEIKGEIPPEVCGFEFELNSRIKEWDGGITLNGETLPLEYNDTDKILISDCDKSLIGNSDYVLKTTDKIKTAGGVSIRSYENAFSTTDGSFKIIDLNWYDADNNKLDANTISSGDTARLCLKAVNTTSDEKKIALTYSSVGKESLNSYKIKEIDVLAGGIINHEIEYTPTDADERVIGFAADGSDYVNLLSAAKLVEKPLTKAEDSLRCSVQIEGYKITEPIIVRVLNKNNELVFQDVYTPSKEGTVDIGFSVGGVSGLYQISASGSSESEVVRLSYTYTDKVKCAEAIKWLDELGSVPDKAEFESRTGDLGFRIGLYETCKDKFLGYVYLMSQKGEFKNSSSEVVLNKLNKAAFVAAIECGESVDLFDFSAELSLDNSEIGKFLNKGFVNDKFKAELNKRLNKGGFNEKDSASLYFDEKLNDEFVLTTVKYSDGTGNIFDVIKAVIDSSVINPNKLSQKVLNAVDGKDFNSISALKSAIDTAYNDNTDSSKGGTSGSGGSGGIKGNVRIDTSQIEDKTPAADTEVKELYSDIENVSWAREAINKLSDLGIVNGDGSGRFMPNENVLREEFTKMAVLAFLDTENASEYGFADVKSDMWYAPFINSAARYGIIKGTGNNTFGIGEEIKRMDMAVIICNAAAYGGIVFDANKEDIQPFADDSEISEYAQDAVYTLKGLGIINGREDNRFDPNASATRAEAAKIIYALLNLKG